MERTPLSSRGATAGIALGRLKVWYCVRYVATGVRGRIDQFLADIAESEIPHIAGRRDQVADSLRAAELALAQDEYLSPEEGGVDILRREERGGGGGEMPDFYGRTPGCWRKPGRDLPRSCRGAAFPPTHVGESEGDI